MRVSHTQLVKLSVVTQSGVELGRIDDIVYDIDQHQVLQYVVRSGMLKQHEYRIHRAQVVSVTAQVMTVEDTVERSKKELQNTESLPSGASPAMMREQ